MSENTPKEKPVKVTPREIINSVKQVTDVDLKQVVTAYRERRITAVPNYRYYPYALMILAMRKLNIQHRVISDWLNTLVVSPHGPMNADKLSALVQQWKKLGLLHHLTDEVIEEYAEKIMLMEKGVIEIPPPGTPLEIDSQVGLTEKVEEEPIKTFPNQFVAVSADDKAIESLEDMFSENKPINLLTFLKNVEKRSGRTLNSVDRNTASMYFDEQDKTKEVGSMVDGLLEKLGWNKQ